MFSQWIVDSNGVGLQICTDSTTADGNPPPCFYDPIVPGNALSESLGRGGEAFWYLADNVFASTGAFPIDGVLVYVNNLDRHFERANQAGATILSVIEEGPPGRRYRAEDLEGHRWFFVEVDHL